MLISKVCEEPSTEMEEEGCLSGRDLSPKPAELVVVTPWNLGASGLTPRRPPTLSGQGRREAEHKALSKFKEVMPLGYVLLSGLQGELSSLLY